MQEPFDDDGADFSPCIESNFLPQEPIYACFRCGVCCRLWVFLNYEEADSIAECVKLPRSEFTIEYWDRSVSPEECLVLEQKDGACFFLRDGKNRKYCEIYDLRPRVCREFVPSLLRRECQRGLSQSWHLKATPTGRIEGDAAQIKAFNDYLRAIAFNQPGAAE